MCLDFTYEEGLLVWALVHVWLTRRPDRMLRHHLDQLRAVDRKFEIAYQVEGAI